MDRQTPVELRHRLCSCLLRFDGINDRETRNLYFAALDDQFGQPLDLHRYSDARYDVWSLLNACVDHPGLLRTLAEVMRVFHGNSTAMEDLQQLVEKIEPAYAGSPDVISPMVPSFGGHVILTSRNADWTTRWRAIGVDVFDRQESIDLLRGRDPGSTREIAAQLAEKLGDLPLALEQAADFQLATGMPITDYVRMLDERSQELLDEGRPPDYPSTLTMQLRQAYTTLRDASPAAADLLGLFAFLGPEPLSAEILRRGNSAEIPQPLGNALRDPVQLGLMIRELARHGLAKVDPREQRIQVHRLTQALLRAELAEDHMRQSRDWVHNLLATANPGDPDNRESWPVHVEIGPHILPSNLIHSGKDSVRKVALDQARYLFRSGQHGASRDLARAMVAIWSRPPQDGGLGRDHEQTLLAFRHLANALRMLGDYGETRRIDEEAYALLLANPDFGDNHQHTVDIAFGLGFDLTMAGDPTGALQRDVENLARATRVYGPHHGYTLQARSNVAADLRQLGRFQQAYELSQNIVDECRDAYGDNDVQTLWHTSELVCDLYGLGRYREAMETQTQVSDAFVQLLEPHRRERLLTEHNIVIILRKIGNHEAALDLARDNHLAFHTHFGVDHEYTLVAEMSHANTLRVAGRLTEAHSAGSAALQGHRTKFGDRHPLTLAAQVNHGIILRLCGDQRAAHELEHATFQALRDVLGEEHPYTLCAANNYANSLVLERRSSAARDLTQRILEISRRVRGEAHPDTFAAEVNAAFDIQATEGGTAGQQLFGHAINGMKLTLGIDHPETLATHSRRRADCDIEPLPT